MNQKKILIIFSCLVSIYGFGKETLKFPQRDISVSISNHEQFIEPAPEDMFSESKISTLQTMSKEDLKGEIVYPIEESNFAEVFGSCP